MSAPRAAYRILLVDGNQFDATAVERLAWGVHATTIRRSGMRVDEQTGEGYKVFDRLVSRTIPASRIHEVVELLDEPEGQR